MSAYEGYEEDVNYITEQSRFVLRILGIWPVFEGKITLAAKIRKLFAVLACYSLLFCEVIPGMLYYAYKAEPDSEVRVDYLIIQMYACMAVLKYSGLVFHEGDIKSCLGRVREDWRKFGGFSHRRSMMERARTARRLFFLCGCFMYFTGVFYNTVVPLSKGKIVVDENTTVRLLACPTYFMFFDEQKSPAYEIVYVVQIFGGIVTTTITITLCGLTAVLVMHACAQLEILAEALKGLVRQKVLKEETLNCSLARVVEHHVKVRNFVHLVEATLQECSLIEVVGCTSIACLLGYCALTEWENGNTVAVFSIVVAIGSILFNIFLLCYIGDRLTTQAEKVAWTSRTLEWYRISDKKVRSLVLIMAMSNTPMRITAGKFIPLSVKTFGDVLKTSAAYFNMLRTITE